jgi:hypothetical protein
MSEIRSEAKDARPSDDEMERQRQLRGLQRATERQRQSEPDRHWQEENEQTKRLMNRARRSVGR